MANTIEITVKVKDQASAETAAIAEKIRADMAAATRGTGGAIKIPVEPDDSRLEEEVTAKVRRAKPDKIKVPLEPDGDRFEQDFRAAMAEGEKAVGDAEREMRRSFTAMESGSRSLRAAMSDLDAPAHEAAAGIEDAGREADNAGHRAENAGGGFRLGAVGMVAMYTAAAGLLPVLAALPAVAGAVAVGAGTMALGLGGVVKALHDYGTQSVSSGQSGAQMAQTAFSNARAIESAEQGIADAKKQAAAAAVSSADQIYSAQERVTSSAYSLQQAEQRLGDAQKAEADAQKALTQARQDAENQLKDLNLQASGANLAVEQAELRLKEAREKLAQVTSNSLSTDDQKKQAALDLAAAQQALAEAQQRQVEAQQAADAANKTGVDGMAGMVTAQDAAARAARGVTDAQHGVSDAARSQDDAQRALAKAVKAASDQQAASADAIAKAQKNLADTYKEQQLAAAAAASAGGGAADKFAQDMAKLTPAGQAFVKQLLSMKSGADQLSATAQTAMLPGLTVMLKDSAPLLPIFNRAVRDMGGIIGDTAAQFGKLMESPAFQGALTQVLKDGAGFAKQMGDGLVGMVSGVMQAASHAGPIVDGLGQGIKTLMTSGIPDFFNALATNASGIGQTFQGILTFVSSLGGPLGTITGAIATALAPAIKVLASPPVQQALQSIATSIGQILIVLSPVVTLFAQGLAGALRIAAPLLQATAKFMQDNHRWIVPLADAIGIATVAWWGLNLALDANPLILIASLIASLVVGLIYCWENFKGFRDFIKKWWPELLAPFTAGVSEIIGHWNLIVDFVKKLPGRLASAAAGIWDWLNVSGAIRWIGDQIDWLVKTVTDLPGKLSRGADHLWDWVGAGFKYVANGVIEGFNWVIRQINGMTQGVSDIWSWAGVPSISRIPELGKLKASGGPITGGLSAIIGERGWEPLRLPDGTTVIPHANAQQALAQGGVGRGGAPSELRIVWDTSGADDELITWFRRRIRIIAGNSSDSVQKALGQAF